MLTVEEIQQPAGTEDSNHTANVNSETSPQAKTSTPSPKTSKSTPSPESNRSASSPEINKKTSYQGIVWPPVKCTPLCFEDGPTGCSNAGKHHELIMTLAKCSNTSETDKTDFKKSLDKFTKTKWLRSDCVPDKNEKLRFPLVHWACILGKYKPLEYLVSEKGFELSVKAGKNQQGPLHSMVQHLSSGLNPKSSKEHVCSMFGNIIDIFLKNVPEAFCEKHASSGDTILHFLAKRCSSDAFSRMYLKTVLVKIKESDKISPEKLGEILSAVNKRGDTFLHVIVSDEESVDTLDYFFGNFGLTSEKISKAKNNFGKTPRQIAVEKRSFKMLKTLGAPDVVINSLKKAVTGPRKSTGSIITPKRVRFADHQRGQKGAVKNSPAAKPSSEENSTLKNKEAPSSRTRRNLTVQKSAQVKPTASAAGDQQGTENISSDQLQAEVLNLCSCDPPTDKKEQPSDSTSPTKRTIEPFPQRFPGREGGNGASAVNNASEVLEMDVNMASLPEHTQEAISDSPDRNVFLSLSNTINSLTKGESLTNNRLTKQESLTNNRKRPATRTLRSRAPSKKRGRGDPWSDSESDAEDDEDFKLDDDSDDDMESEVEEEEEEEEETANDMKEEEAVDDAPKEVNKETNEDDIELETAPKHTPFCRQNCISQHHKLLLSLMKCSNYAYGIAYIDTFIKQVTEYINQLGKFSDVRANADLPDPVASFKYPLVHWVCVLGKFKVLEKLAEMKEFNLGVQSDRTGETGLHRMLLSLDRAMVLRKYSVKTILEVFSKTLKTLTDNLPSVITACNKEGDTPFHCLAKVILDCTGELEKMNTYEGYFEHLIKDLTRLKTSGKLTPEIVKELLLKTNNSQETFLHILACRHGVGHRVIKSVLKNIDPEIMDVLKEMKNADGKTPSDLAEDLCSYEMAAILRPRDQEPATMDGENAAEELPQTPDHSAPQESPEMQSPPATLFHPMEYAMSPFVPDGSAARMRLFTIKKEPVEDEPVNDSLRECLVEVNDSPCTPEKMETVPLRAVKLSPSKYNSTSTRRTGEDVDVITSSSASGSSESVTEAAATSSLNVSTNHHNAATKTTLPANSSKSISTPTTSTNHNRATSSPTTNHSKSNSGESSIMSGIINMPQSDKLLNTLHAKFQEQLVQSEKGLKEKEEAHVRVRQRITEAQERKQNLLRELEETWNEMLAATREEGVIQSEIAAKKRDCERFRTELTKYETSLKTMRE